MQPLLPKKPPEPKGGRPRIDDRAAVAGIPFVLKTGILWEMLPQEMGCGSGMTCSGSASRNGTRSGWERLHKKLLDRPGQADQLIELGCALLCWSYSLRTC